MRVGLDFDNTIAGYDHVFLRLAREKGLLPDGFRGGKRAIRDALLNDPGGLMHWQTIQGQVYGAGMREARLMEGIGAFFSRCADDSTVSIFIVSHKTEYGHFDEARVNLRQAALSWMDDLGFFSASGFRLSRDEVFFEPTLDAKVSRIADLNCAVFVDDLEEVLSHPKFPTTTRGILYASDEPTVCQQFETYPCWTGVTKAVFDG